MYRRVGTATSAIRNALMACSRRLLSFALVGRGYHPTGLISSLLHEAKHISGLSNATNSHAAFASPFGDVLRTPNETFFEAALTCTILSGYSPPVASTACPPPLPLLRLASCSQVKPEAVASSIHAAGVALQFSHDAQHFIHCQRDTAGGSVRRSLLENRHSFLKQKE